MWRHNYVSVNSKPDHPPGNFFDGRIPHPSGKKSSKPPPPEAFFSIIHYKNNETEIM